MSIKYIFRKIKYSLNHGISLWKIRQKQSKNEVINIAFFIMYDSSFVVSPIIDIISEYNFNPLIVIIPDVSRGFENMIIQMDKCYDYIKERHPNIKVLYTYDKKKSLFIDISKEIDIFIYSCPYNNMYHKLYSIKYLTKQYKLPIFIPYGYTSADFFSNENIYSENCVLRSWKVFVETLNVEQYLKCNSKLNGYNVVLSGYCKMDGIYNMYKKNNQITIILAPHHTIGREMPNYSLSNFLKFSDFFLELPNLYPDVFFIFRPHPLLRVVLSNDNYWGKKKTDNYFEKISNYTNVRYEAGGSSYFDSFINSDGIITDCGSFLVEYLYTDNPGCYMLKNDFVTNSIFNEFGKKCLFYYYTAYNEEDIVSYIDNIVLLRQDYKKCERIEFVKKEIKINFPHVSYFILDYIENKIGKRKNND